MVHVDLVRGCKDNPDFAELIPGRSRGVHLSIERARLQLRDRLIFFHLCEVRMIVHQVRQVWYGRA